MQGSQAFFRPFGLAWLGLTLFGVGAQAVPPVAKTKMPAGSSVVLAHIDYDRDVRPILSENCFKCHGFDPNQRQAGLRLDREESASGPLASGAHAIVPGKPGASAVMQRVLAGGALHMPPVSTGKKLTPAQILVLKQWITQGGKYDAHWAFVTPKRPAVPTVRNTAWAKNPLDRFILARLEKEGLKPSPEADRGILIRRLSFDLTGLPPTPAEVDAFVHDPGKDAYDKVVDRLLASPRYGERMAVSWLDLARYADTHGFHIDSQRDMWRWREWVIEAYNKNLSYDQFVVQQLAGDLLPNPTLDQRIASGFNRNHPINFEGGAIPEEYATAYIVDRIDTTATAFMGLTMRCAQCHDHKYDPVTQKDYYRFFALFHNVSEQGLDGSAGNAVPFLKAPDAAQKAQLEAAPISGPKLGSSAAINFRMAHGSIPPLRRR
jgi:mono/diheme cytochrome c family protein